MTEALIDYLPIIIGLITAIIGVRGFTWNDKAKGWRRITPNGRLVIIMAMITFILAIWVIKRKNDQIRDVIAIRHIAQKQVLEGIDFLIWPLNRGAILVNDDSFFIKIKDTSHLSKIFDGPVIQSLNGFADSTKVFDNQYQEDSISVQRGADKMYDAIVKYNNYLDAETIIEINKVLDNDFFVQRYSLKNSRKHFELALDEFHKKKNFYPTFGTFRAYFWSPDKTKSPADRTDYDGAIFLLNQIDSLDQHIHSSLTE